MGFDPDDVQRLDAIPISYILSRSRHPVAKCRLENRARSGDHSARIFIYSDLLDDAALLIASDPSRPAWQRRSAVWRLPDPDDELILAILKLDPADLNDGVLTTVLLAERQLGIPAADELALRWMTDFNDNRKRAGALLAALLNVHHERLLSAYEAEDIASVRTTQRLALIAMGRDPGLEVPIEFAHRTLFTEDGDINLDTLLCLLIMGDAGAPTWLTNLPPDHESWKIRLRLMLIERFIPHLSDAAGSLPTTNRQVAELHFDSLDALRLLTQRRVEFDPTRKQFVWPSD